MFWKLSMGWQLLEPRHWRGKRLRKKIGILKTRWIWITADGHRGRAVPPRYSGTEAAVAVEDQERGWIAIPKGGGGAHMTI